MLFSALAEVVFDEAQTEKIGKIISDKLGDLFDGTGFALLYLTIALAAAVALIGLIIYKFRRDKFRDFGKYAVGIAVGYAVSVLVVMTYLKVQVDGGYVPVLFYPILSMLVILVAGGIAMLISSLFSRKAVKISGIITALGALGAFIAVMVYINRYFGDISEYYPRANTTGLIVSAVVFMVLIAVIYVLGGKKEINDTRAIVYGAIAVALSFALSYVRLFRLPQGGTVSLASLLPLMVYCMMFGTRRGVVVCLIFGVLQAVQDPFIIHPMQFLLDYPLAFGCIGVSGLLAEKGLFKNKKILAFLLGGIVAVILRYACHVCSGVFAFADYVNFDKYDTALIYSLTYNSVAFVDMAIALAAGSVLFASKAFTAQMTRSMESSKSKRVSAQNDEEDEDRLAAADNVSVLNDSGSARTDGK